MDKIDFIQLGAFKGKSETDIIWHTSKKYNWNGIFVEPLKGNFDELLKYYNNTDNHCFENAAVVPENYNNIDDKVYLFYDPGCTSSATTLDRSLYNEHRVVVDSTKLSTLIKKYDMINTDFELLQIDIEGIDDKIILSTNFNKVRPKIIRYESIHLSEESQRKVHVYLYQFGYSKVKDPYYADYQNENPIAEAEHYNSIYQRYVPALDIIPGLQVFKEKKENKVEGTANIKL
jgi:FkbM family methyltransferase